MSPKPHNLDTRVGLFLFPLRSPLDLLVCFLLLQDLTLGGHRFVPEFFGDLG